MGTCSIFLKHLWTRLVSRARIHWDVWAFSTIMDTLRSSSCVMSALPLPRTPDHFLFAWTSSVGAAPRSVIATNGVGSGGGDDMTRRTCNLCGISEDEVPIAQKFEVSLCPDDLFGVAGYADILAKRGTREWERAWWWRYEWLKKGLEQKTDA